MFLILLYLLHFGIFLYELLVYYNHYFNYWYYVLWIDYKGIYLKYNYTHLHEYRIVYLKTSDSFGYYNKMYEMSILVCTLATWVKKVYFTEPVNLWGKLRQFYLIVTYILRLRLCLPNFVNYTLNRIFWALWASSTNDNERMASKVIIIITQYSIIFATCLHPNMFLTHWNKYLLYIFN